MLHIETPMSPLSCLCFQNGGVSKIDIANLDVLQLTFLIDYKSVTLDGIKM